MAKSKIAKTSLVIAGPGAGKTHNMVEEIISHLPQLHPCRFMAVVTHTNSATNNIKKRLANKISVPPNLFVGTIHAFLNKFIVIPFSSFGDRKVGIDKMFMQFGINDLFQQIEKDKPKAQRCSTFQEKATVKKNIKNSMNAKGYITFDQTLSIAKESMEKDKICQLVANRLQFLFVDEFQDTGTEVFLILERLRKLNLTKIYCVGDPEQYILSFDSSIKMFNNIPILKAATSSNYDVQFNSSNFRCGSKIVTFLNHFNKRVLNSEAFQQIAKSKNDAPSVAGYDVLFIRETLDVKPIVEKFNDICEQSSIVVGNRCLIAKSNAVIAKITAVLNNRYMNPKKDSFSSPFKIIQDVLLYTLGLNSSQFCKKHGWTPHDLRKLTIELFHQIRKGAIASENAFGNYIKDHHDLIMVEKLTVKIENLKFDYVVSEDNSNVMTVANIHTIKGMEHEAVLVIARNEEELLGWIETDRIKRDEDKDDVCRLGYVAFSRAERLLCIACLENVSLETQRILNKLGVLL
ncbi:UvrD-helicase domain-containing protein [Pedobacter nototheniae]|uniref:UvrD-helicase domain-containing protein n=1 Tax=Pedobacter nototheniae TaxID=2488994 RepID=UPI00292DB1F9|nr:UvrD-helicase domain-containing protein [Pedobacter nototheniae]